MTRRVIRVTWSLPALAVALAGCSSVPRGLAPVQPQLLRLELTEASFEGQRFAVELLLTNPNAVDLPVRSVEFDVRLAGEGFLETESALPFTLPAGGRETLRLEIFSTTVSSASRLLSLAEGPQNALSYELQGQLTLDVGLRDPVPMASRGQVPLTMRSSGATN